MKTMLRSNNGKYLEKNLEIGDVLFLSVDKVFERIGGLWVCSHGLLKGRTLQLCSEISKFRRNRIVCGMSISKDNEAHFVEVEENEKRAELLTWVGIARNGCWPP